MGNPRHYRLCPDRAMSKPISSWCTLVLEKNKSVDCSCCAVIHARNRCSRPKLGHHVLLTAKSKSTDMLVVPLCWKKRECWLCPCCAVIHARNWCSRPKLGQHVLIVNGQEQVYGHACGASVLEKEKREEKKSVDCPFCAMIHAKKSM